MRERWRQWLEETHGPFFELVRHFFHRMFESELITTPDQLRTWVVGVLAAILSFTLYVPLSQFRKYVELTMAGNAAQYHAHAMSDRLLFIIFPMLLVSFVAALEWQSLFPTERDYRNLMPLPVSRMQMFLAKLTAMTLFVLLFVGAVNLFPGFELPMVQMSSLMLEPFHIKHILGHLCAAAAGSLFAFLSLVALQGLLMNVLGRRLFPRVSLAVQSVLLLALLTALPHVLTVSTLYRRGGIPHEVMMWAPPFWFHGMYETFIGRSAAPFPELAARAWMGLGLAAAATLSLYALTYIRQAMVQAEAENKLPFPLLEAVLRRFFRLWQRKEEKFAIVSFVFKTLARSRQHKLVLSAYLGIGLAVLVNMWVMDWLQASTLRRMDLAQQEIVHTALSAPLVMAFFFLSGLRLVFTIPITLQANWVFRLLEGDRRMDWLDAVESTFYALALLPVLVIAPLFLVPLMGWTLLPGHLVICALLMLILVELMLWEWQKVPFVCSYLPGKRNVALTFMLYWIGFSLYALAMTRFEAWSLRAYPRWLILAGLLLAVFAKVREIRRESWGLLPLKYEEEPEKLVETLGLAG